MACAPTRACSDCRSTGFWPAEYGPPDVVRPAKAGDRPRPPLPGDLRGSSVIRQPGLITLTGYVSAESYWPARRPRSLPRTFGADADHRLRPFTTHPRRSYRYFGFHRRLASAPTWLPLDLTLSPSVAGVLPVEPLPDIFTTGSLFGVPSAATYP